jgi:hypothetical protein
MMWSYPEDLETFAAIQQRRPHHALPIYEETQTQPSCEIFPAPLDRVGFAGTERRQDRLTLALAGKAALPRTREVTAGVPGAGARGSRRCIVCLSELKLTPPAAFREKDRASAP